MRLISCLPQQSEAINEYQPSHSFVPVALSLHASPFLPSPPLMLSALSRRVPLPAVCVSSRGALTLRITKCRPTPTHQRRQSTTDSPAHASPPELIPFTSTPGRSEYKSVDLTPEDRERRRAAFEAAVAREERMWRAHQNHKNDRHVQVAIDCAYDATKGNYTLAASLVNQVMNCIGYNRRAERPVKLWVTQWPTHIAGGPQFTYVHDEQCMLSDKEDVTAPYDHASIAAQFASRSLPPFLQAILTSDSRFNNPSCPSRTPRVWGAAVDSRSVSDIFRPSSVVYLTPDAPDTLEEIDSNHVYVIGGLVDRTVTNGVSYQRAAKEGFKMARLPVREHLGSISKSASLNVDTVFSILVDVAQKQREEKRRLKQIEEDGSSMPDNETNAPTAHDSTSSSPSPLVSSASSVFGFLPPATIKSQWREVLQKHIPARYWQHNVQRLSSAASSSKQPADTRSPAVLASQPTPRTHIARSGSTHLRRQEVKWIYQLQRVRLTAAELGHRGVE